MTYNRQAMIEAMMTRTGKMMDDKFERNDKKTQRKLNHIEAQIETVAEATEHCINDIKQVQDETQRDIATLKETMHNMKNTQTTSANTTQRPDANVLHQASDEERVRQIIVHGFDTNTD